MKKLLSIMAVIIANIVPGLSMDKAQNGPIVHLWPEGSSSNAPYFGHASVCTKTYYISFGPQENSGVIEPIKDAPSKIVPLLDLDKQKYNKSACTEYTLSSLSEKGVNEGYEDCLHYNKVTPDNYTIDHLEGLQKSGKLSTVLSKYDSLHLKKTRYSVLHSDNFLQKDFYTSPHTCMTFSLALLQYGGAEMPTYLFFGEEREKVRAQNIKMGIAAEVPMYIREKEIVESAVVDYGSFKKYLLNIQKNGKYKKEDYAVF